MNQKSTYKWCFVPNCTNTSISAPEKLFFFVPQNEDRRNKWFRIAHRPDLPTKSNYYCCQDHFNIEEDMENYMKFLVYGGPLKLKQDATPHIFTCQTNRVKVSSGRPRTALQKINRKREIAQILFEDSRNKENAPTNVNGNEKPDPKVKRIETPPVPSTSMRACMNTSTSTAEIMDLPEPHAGSEEVLSFGKPGTSGVLREANSMKVSNQRSVGVQVHTYLSKPHVRSKYTLCKPMVRDASSQCSVQTVDKMCSSIKNKKIPASVKCDTHSSATPPGSQISGSFLSTHSEYKISSQSENKLSSTDSGEVDSKKKGMSVSALHLTRYFISVNPRSYIGILEDWMWIIDLLHSETSISIDNIKLTLMKVRMNNTYSQLGDHFGLSTSQASRVFNKCVQPLGHMLKTLIYCPKKNSIKKALPIPFRTHFSHVHAIVDAFEIQIEKPSDPVAQALTWSEYKKCNTLKYLISCTPDGLINFISPGYGGPISDVLLFETSGIMDILPENCGVMADRGFKQIQNVLNKKNCELIRPPSVSASTKPTKEEVLKTKRIASLRIHIERVIRRIREYKILEPHSCLDVYIMTNIDYIVTIAAALMNIQRPIIKV